MNPGNGTSGFFLQNRIVQQLINEEMIRRAVDNIYFHIGHCQVMNSTNFEQLGIMKKLLFFEINILNLLTIFKCFFFPYFFLTITELKIQI